MIRGTLYLLLPEKKVIRTTEFNGGMDIFQHGQEVIYNLKKVKTALEFVKMVFKFNKTHHNYPEQLSYDFKYFYDGENFVDFKKNYFDRFSSDYLYIKNLSGIPIHAIDGLRYKFTIQQNDIIVIWFKELKYHNQMIFQTEEV